MKTKFIALLALMFCMGVFLFPTTAYACSPTGYVGELTVHAAVEGETLRIEAVGGFLGVEAIFINNQRFNFRVDGVLRVDLLAFRDSNALSIHAVDFAGNMSNVVVIANPMYIGNQPTATPTPTPPQEIPVTSNNTPNPFTPAGQATVLDNVTDGDEKEFFTFTTPAGNVFFLIVDRQRESDNVYFLNAVTEQDLVALAAQAGTELNVSSSGGIPVSTTPQTPSEQPPDTTQEEPTAPPPADDSGGGNGTLIFLLVAVAVAGGVGYYLKIVRPKQQGGNCDYEDEDEEDIGEEMEFETEPDVAEADKDEDYYNTDEDEPRTEDEQ
jgi:hypothetical protein